MVQDYHDLLHKILSSQDNLSTSLARLRLAPIQLDSLKAWLASMYAYTPFFTNYHIMLN